MATAIILKGVLATRHLDRQGHGASLADVGIPAPRQDSDDRVFGNQRFGCVDQCRHITIPNPAWAVYPQWKPEPLPAIRMDRGLTVACWRHWDQNRMRGKELAVQPPISEMKTRLVFSLAEEGTPSSSTGFQSGDVH